jgi:hypothetical protein
MRLAPFKAMLLASILLGAAGGCAEAPADAAHGGLTIDPTTEAYLRDVFVATQDCAGIHAGSFEELAVVMMPPAFPCQYYASGCNGEFIQPNIIRVGVPGAWPHEIIHYLLDKSTGDPDPNHTNPLFADCA